MTYVSEPLHDHHVLDVFDSGKPELDLWLRNSARHAQRNRTCSVTVWHDCDDVVLGYYGLVAHVVQREDLTPKVGRGSLDQIPAVLLARLALDRRIQGSGLGGILLADAFAKILEASGNVGVRLVVVDAIDDQAAKFYEKHGFTPTPVEGRLVRKVSDIAADFERAADTETEQVDGPL